MRLLVNIYDTEIIIVDTSEKDTVDSLKKSIRESHGISERRQKLFYYGEELRDLDTLEKCELKNYSLLNMSLTFRPKI